MRCCAVNGRPPTSHAELERLHALIADWLARELAENEVVAAVDVEAGDRRRWFVRLHGEEKASFTIWFTLRQRTLHYETYFLPAPQRGHQALFEHLLRRNGKLYGASFSVGEEDAIFLSGQIANESIDELELDRILWSMYAYVEQCFVPALEIGFSVLYK